MQAGLLLLACVVVVAFLRFYLVTSAAAFRSEFERQSFVDLTRGETFLLARKLAALGKSAQFACIAATKSGILFFEERRSSCGTGLFTVRQQVVEANHQIEIDFRIRLHESLLWGLGFFLSVQAVLAASMLLSQRRLHWLAHEHELELAALARQVAHDIQSPLAILQGLAKSALGEKEHFVLRARALQRLRALVGHLGAGSKEEEETNALGPLLASALREKEAENHGKLAPHIQLRWMSELGSYRLAGTAFEWRRVLSNLLNNSIEASPGRAAEIEIAVTAVSDGKVSLRLQDCGNGIPANVLSQITQQGFTHGKERGQGLGLYLAQKYARSLGGTLRVESEVGKGTAVTLEIPAVSETSVVLVEDDLELAKLWRQVAQKRGIHLQHYASATELLAAKDGLTKDITIYLDVELAQGGESGLVLGEQLAKEGFRQIYLATGRPAKAFQGLAWVRGVQGKEPPWL